MNWTRINYLNQRKTEISCDILSIFKILWHSWFNSTTVTKILNGEQRIEFKYFFLQAQNSCFLANVAEQFQNSKLFNLFHTDFSNLANGSMPYEHSIFNVKNKWDVSGEKVTGSGSTFSFSGSLNKWSGQFQFISSTFTLHSRGQDKFNPTCVHWIFSFDRSIRGRDILNLDNLTIAIVSICTRKVFTVSLWKVRMWKSACYNKNALATLIVVWYFPEVNWRKIPWTPGLCSSRPVRQCLPRTFDKWFNFNHSDNLCVWHRVLYPVKWPSHANLCKRDRPLQ